MGLLSRAVLAHRGWRYRTRVDPDEIRWMRSVLRPGDLVVDVGAYKGGYTYWMRREVGEAGLVLAFEPQPTLAGYLCERVRDFGWQNVHVHETALSSEPGTRRLYRPGAESTPAASLVGASLPEGAEGYDVSVATLDAVLERVAPGRPVRLIKCDVEGHELDVFVGASAAIEAHRPHLLFECEERHLEERGMRDVFAYLERLGYAGSFFWRGERRPVGEHRAERHQVEGQRPYVNNFVFVHPATS
ncbi:MAG: FkbM family methyltransferase [Gemmatimonadota bacterium]|jgi:FkbM family methyltransferase